MQKNEKKKGGKTNVEEIFSVSLFCIIFLRNYVSAHQLYSSQKRKKAFFFSFGKMQKKEKKKGGKTNVEEIFSVSLFCILFLRILSNYVSAHQLYLSQKEKKADSFLFQPPTILVIFLFSFPPNKSTDG